MKILTSREAFFGVLFFFAGGTASPGERQTENLILITIDGVRRQEMFGGLDLEIVRSLTKKGKVEDTSTYKKYWASTPEERRAKVMPFFWGTLMKDRGSIEPSRRVVEHRNRFPEPDRRHPVPIFGARLQRAKPNGWKADRAVVQGLKLPGIKKPAACEVCRSQPIAGLPGP